MKNDIQVMLGIDGFNQNEIKNLIDEFEEKLKEKKYEANIMLECCTPLQASYINVKGCLKQKRTAEIYEIIKNLNPYKMNLSKENIGEIYSTIGTKYYRKIIHFVETPGVEHPVIAIPCDKFGIELSPYTTAFTTDGKRVQMEGSPSNVRLDKLQKQIATKKMINVIFKLKNKMLETCHLCEGNAFYKEVKAAKEGDELSTGEIILKKTELMAVLSETGEIVEIQNL
jgi:hypothetical protein